MTRLPEVDEPAVGDATASRLDVKRANRRRIVERRWSIVGIVLVVLLANGLSLLHVVNPNPINQVSGLGTAAQASVLPGGDNIDPNVGFTAQALGHLAAEDWIHGHVPWWDPYEGVGAPLAGEMQSAAFFPPVLFDLMPNGQVFFRISLEILAGIGAYLLLRRFVRSNLPAFVGGAAFALNGAFSWLFHAAANPIAFLPFIILGYELAREGALDQRRKGWAVLALALSLSIYAGFPETTFIDGIFAVLWMIVRSVGLQRRNLVVLAKSLGLALGVTIALAAPIVVAFLDYLPHANIGGHSTMFARASLNATTALPSQILPYVFGPIFGFTNVGSTGLAEFWSGIGGYLGISATFLSVVGLAGRNHRGLRIAMAGWVVLGVARMVGVSIVIDVFNLIPGVSYTAFSRYAVGSWVLALLVLAALGLDDLLARSLSYRTVVIAGVITLGLCLWAWHVATPVVNALHDEMSSGLWAVASLWWAVFVVAGLVAVALVPDSVHGVDLHSARRIGLAALILLDAGAMFVVPQLSAPRAESIDQGPVHYLARHLGQERFFTLGPLAPNYGSYFGLSSLAVNDVPIPKSFGEYITTHLDANVAGTVFNGLNMADPSGPTPQQELLKHLANYESAGVKYVLLPAGSPSPVSRGTPLKEVYHDGAVEIVELPDPAPLFGSPRTNCSVTAKSPSQAVVDCPSRSTIVYRQLSMPGWHATVNGTPVSPRAYGPLFQSVQVPAGVSNVEFGYTPPFADAAFVLLLIGIAAILLAFPPVREKAAEVVRTRKLSGTAGA